MEVFFFYPEFRNKTLEERKSLPKKCMVCIKCLAPVPNRHDCPVQKCKTCGSGHNILLCHKSDQDKAFLLETESDITDEELQEIQD